MQYNFDARSVSPVTDFPQLPEGWYPGTITAEEQLPTGENGANGSHLQLTLTVAPHHPAANQTQIDRLNLWYTAEANKETTLRMAHARLSAYCYAGGIMQLQDTRQLLGIQLQFKVEKQAKNPKYTQVTAIRYADGREIDPEGKKAGQPAQMPAPVTVAAPAYAPPAQPQYAPAPPAAPIQMGYPPAPPLAQPQYAPAPPQQFQAPAPPASQQGVWQVPPQQAPPGWVK